MQSHFVSQNNHLDLLVEMTEDVINLVLETARQHLIGLIKNELLDVVGPQHLQIVCYKDFIENGIMINQLKDH